MNGEVDKSVKARGVEPGRQRRPRFALAATRQPGFAALSVLLFALGVCSSRAQPLSNLIFTVGTTIQDGSGNPWSYVLLGAPQASLLAGKRFAIYGKPGFPTNASTFTLRGTIFQQSNATAINTLLNQSVGLGEDLAALGNALDTLLHNVPGIGAQPLPQKVLIAFQVAASDPFTNQALYLLARTHPGLTLCAGQAFAEPLTTTTTYEVREVNPASGAAGDVLGRVTITPGAPVVLPAPGFPYQVVTNDPSDHLRIRLRWGTPDNLRRLSLLQYGFNVWRIPRAGAEAAGYNTNNPTRVQLHNGAFTLVNAAPVMATRDYSPFLGPGGAADPMDRITYFFADDNGRSLGSVHFPSNSPPHAGYLNPPFNDGEEFYYFITARDILGRDGFVSPGGLARACRRLRPQPPTGLKVVNEPQIIVSGGVTNLQSYLRVNWQQNTGTNDLVTEYWIYRWWNPAMALTNDPTPLSNRVAVVAQVPGTNFNTFLDTSAGALVAPGPSNIWYTLRAVSQAACDPLLSPQSPPAWGVLRQRAGPLATSGELVSSCGTPVVAFQNFNSLVNSAGRDTNHWNYRFTCRRRDPGIAWVQFLITNTITAGYDTIGPVCFPPDGDTVSVDYSTLITSSFPEVDAGCVVGTYYGLVSQPAVTQYTNAVPAGQRLEEVFLAGELLLTALNSGDPLLAAVNGAQSFCMSPYSVVPDASGTLHLRFDLGGNIPLMIQYATNFSNPAGGQGWVEMGVATPDANGVYSIYWEPCLIGPLPPFRGCRVNLPGETDCSQHVARDGGGTVAPIHIRFRLTPRTHEYRLYRRIDDGPLTLIAQGAALFDPLSPAKEIVRTDDAMPPTAARLCYFVQVLDENGNGSPMALIGCRDVKPIKPPRPVLSEPAPTGDTNNPQVALTWFCPTSGVYRFEVRIQRADQPASGQPTGFHSPKLLRLTSSNPQVRFLGLLVDRLAVSLFDETLVTPPIGPGFGPGPQFSLNASVVPGVPYNITVAAEDAQGNWGDASQQWTFIWKPPNPLVTVPWPARPLPPVTAFDDASSASNLDYYPRVSAVLFTNYNGTVADYHYPVGVRVAQVNTPYWYSNVGSNTLAVYNVYPGFAGAAGRIDPNVGVFHRLANDSRLNDPLLPIVLYRQQVTNAAFPRVSGTLTQVSPMLEQVAWTSQGNLRANGVTVSIADRLIALDGEVINDHSYAFLYLRDQQPVIIGAAYQYFVVRFNDRREIAEIIPAGVVQIPANP